ncbi:hypothetical protein [Caminibacter sp.]
MKKGGIFLTITFLFAINIKVINGIHPDINISLLKKYSNMVITKSSFDNERHKYRFVFLEKFRNLYCPFSKKITFCSTDDYNVTFDLKEIINKNIIFAFEEDGKPISLEERGPAKIIYIRDKDPVKEIFNIDKIICD